MSQFLHHFLTGLLCLAAGLGFVACSDTEEARPALIDAPSFRITIRCNSTPVHSRAAGPSADDGYWPGNGNENHIDNATLLFYQDEQGINGSSDTRIAFGIYAPHFQTEADGEDGTRFVTSENILLPQTLVQGTYHILALCNVGDYTRYVGRTLGEVRDLVIEKPYHAAQDLGAYSYFAMSSSQDGAHEITASSAQLEDGHPLFHITLPVQRLAARIDFSPGDPNAFGGTWGTEEITVNPTAGTKLSGYYKFPVTITYDENTLVENGDFFYLTSVTPFNVLSAGGYAFKRVTEGTSTDGALRYLGAETVSPSDGTATNYVLTPWTRGLGTTGSPTPTYQNPHATLTTDEETFKEAELPVTEIAEGQDLCYKVQETDAATYKIWCYAPENTLPASASKQAYATGLLLKGYYAKRVEETPGQVSYEYFPKTYEVFVRHTDPHNSNNDALPMKYGVVRNHVYRISVSRVSSLGLIMVQVVDWQPIRVPEIQM